MTLRKTLRTILMILCLMPEQFIYDPLSMLEQFIYDTLSDAGGIKRL